MEAEHYARYWWASALVADRRVLDAGCGVGYGARILADGSASDVVGVDVSPLAVGAASRFETPSLRFQQGDVRTLDLASDQFDVVVCFEVLEHVDRRDDVLAELRRVLTPTGLLVISSPNRGVYPPGNPHHLYEYRPEELRTALRQLFQNVDLRRQHCWLASAIMNDHEVRHRDPTVPINGLECAKVSESNPDSEIYTIALASDGPLPAGHARSVWTGLEEPEKWFAEIRRLREEHGQLTAELNQQKAEAAALAHERDELLEIERGLRRDARQLIAELRAAHDALHQLYSSLSWRLTRPMRDAGRAMRKISSAVRDS
jgi:SAM-dependent methyltransferase